MAIPLLYVRTAPEESRVVISIRSFKSTDAAKVCELWERHHAELGLNSELSEQQLELACLAKPYFDARHLLIACDSQGEVAGFLQHGPVANENLTDVHDSHVAIYALCVPRNPEQDDIALALLDQFEEACVANQRLSAWFRPTLPHCGFNLSLGPADSLVSVISEEVHLCNWLAQSGFSPKQPTSMWELQLAGFQPPIDRQQLQIRRSTAVNQQLDEPALPWWQACALGHTEPVSYELTHRAERRVLCRILYWNLGPEVMPDAMESIVWLWPPEELEEPQGLDYQMFLLAESLRQLQQQHVDVVRTAADADDQGITRILRKLGFQPTFNGMLFEKTW